MTDILDWTWAVAGDAPAASSRTDDIWFFDETHGWLVNSNGQVCETTDGGATWQQKAFIDPGTPGFPYLRCLGWPNSSTGWIGAVTSFRSGNDFLNILLHKTTDGGASWTAIGNMPANAPAGICGMFAVSEDVLYGAGTNDPSLPGPGVVKTTDGGANWTLIDMTAHADNLIDCYFSDENTGWVVGGKIDPACPKTKEGFETAPQYAPLKPVVLKTTDGGATWVNKAAGVAGFDCGEWGWKIQWLDALHGFVSLENFTAAAILVTTDGGETWTRRPIANAGGTEINMNLEGVGFLTPDQGWVGGWGAKFEGLFNSVTTDGGATWIAQDHDPADPASDARIRVNRYRMIGDPVHTAFCSGLTVYKGGPRAQMEGVAAAAAARFARPAPAGYALAHVPFDSRGLDPQATGYLKALASRTAPRVLELGPGAGLAAAGIRRLLPHCVLETVSLTPIDPFLWPDPDQPGTPPLKGTACEIPFIERQHVGQAEPCLDALDGPFDVIYDSFGPLFWRLTEAMRADDRTGGRRLVAAVLRLLGPGGLLFVAASEGEHWLEGLLERLSASLDRLELFPPRFAATQIRTCVFEKCPERTSHG